MSRAFAAAIFLLTALWAYNCPGQEQEFNFKNPGDYNNFIMKEMAASVQKNFEFLSFAVHSEDYDLMDTKRKEVVRQINESKDKIGKMPAINGDTQLRDEAVEALNEYKNAFELDFKDVIGLKKKSKDSYEAMENYFKAEDKAEEKVTNATNRLRKVQERYASKNNMKIVNPGEDDALEQKMARISAVNAYWRGIFLQYFKVSKIYDKMWDMLAQQKPGPLEHQRVEVVTIAEKTLPLLKSRPDFNGDVEFRDQTVTVVEYYLKVARDDFGKIVEMLNKKNLTQEDIDFVNSIVNHCNADHERLAYNWNIATQDLFRKNVDKE